MRRRRTGSQCRGPWEGFSGSSCRTVRDTHAAAQARYIPRTRMHTKSCTLRKETDKETIRPNLHGRAGRVVIIASSFKEMTSKALARALHGGHTRLYKSCGGLSAACGIFGRFMRFYCGTGARRSEQQPPKQEGVELQDLATWVYFGREERGGCRAAIRNNPRGFSFCFFFFFSPQRK